MPLLTFLWEKVPDHLLSEHTLLGGGSWQRAQSVIPALVPERGLGSVDVPEVLLAAAVEGTGGKCRTGTLPRATIAA